MVYLFVLQKQALRRETLERPSEAILKKKIIFYNCLKKLNMFRLLKILIFFINYEFIKKYFEIITNKIFIIKYLCHLKEIIYKTIIN